MNTIMLTAAMDFRPLILCFFGVMSLISFIQFGEDKRRAKKGKWRIEERTLLLFAGLGGGIGAMIGMLVFHHKTQHKQFQILVPIFAILQIALIVFLMIKLS